MLALYLLHSYMLSLCYMCSVHCVIRYIGDSVTDLLAMLHADIGIVVGNAKSFK
jgi:hypothetical protein